MNAELTEAVIATARLAARKLTGSLRRAFQAEMAERYCSSSPRLAEEVFGWGREAVRTGLGERRSGIQCLDDFSSRGRKKSEAKVPQLAEEIRAVVEPHSQADPKFQTPLAFTRITSKAVREALLAKSELRASGLRAEDVPAERTLVTILNRLGYCLRRVLKTRPQKNSRDRRDLRSGASRSRTRRERSRVLASVDRHQSESEDR